MSGVAGASLAIRRRIMVYPVRDSIAESEPVNNRNRGGCVFVPIDIDNQNALRIARRPIINVQAGVTKPHRAIAVLAPS